MHIHAHQRILRFGFLAVVPFLVRAQAPAPVSVRVFDAASVKPVDRGQRPPVRLDCSPGRFESTVALRMVVAWAYGQKVTEIFGGEGWGKISEGQYDIKANADRAMSVDECKSMVQRLLGERFKLALHRETREQPVYALVVAKNGTKLRDATGEPANPSDIPSINGMPIRSVIDKSGLRGLTIPGLAVFLQIELIRAEHRSGVQNRPIVDKTGLTGVYRVRLDFSRSSDDDTHPDLFTALQEQLGLKLEPRKEPIDVLVIDNVEKPAEN